MEDNHHIIKDFFKGLHAAVGEFFTCSNLPLFKSEKTAFTKALTSSVKDSSTDNTND